LVFNHILFLLCKYLHFLIITKYYAERFEYKLILKFISQLLESLDEDCAKHFLLYCLNSLNVLMFINFLFRF